MNLITTSGHARGEPRPAPSIAVGISACLLGNEVRYNGGHSRSTLCQQTLSGYFRFRSFCPEVAAGFGVPRPTLRLMGDPRHPRRVFAHDPSVDLSDSLRRALIPVVDTLTELDGYILMKNSPSCGLERVKVYQDNGPPHPERGQGLFTAVLRRRYPDLPVEEEGRLNDARLRENFILRVYAHNHFRTQVDGAPSLGRLMDFHRDYKYVLMAHSQSEYRALGRLLAVADPADSVELRDRYHRRFMQAIAQPASRRGHCNVLLHILGYLKKSVESGARRRIADLIERYRLGEVNLATPLALVAHYIDQHGSAYIRRQRYLEFIDPLGGLLKPVLGIDRQLLSVGQGRSRIGQLTQALDFVDGVAPQGLPERLLLPLGRKTGALAADTTGRHPPLLLQFVHQGAGLGRKGGDLPQLFGLLRGSPAVHQGQPDEEQDAKQRQPRNNKKFGFQRQGGATYHGDTIDILMGCPRRGGWPRLQRSLSR